METEDEKAGDLDIVVLCEGVLDIVVVCVTVGVPLAERDMGGVPVRAGVPETVLEDDSELVWVVLWVLVLEDAADCVEDGELVLDNVGLGARETVADLVILVEPVGVCVREGEEDIDTRCVRDVLGDRVPFTVGVPVAEEVVVLLAVVVREMVGVVV